LKRPQASEPAAEILTLNFPKGKEPAPDAAGLVAQAGLAIIAGCDGVTPNASHMRQQHEEHARVCGLNHLSATQAEAETNHFLPAQLHPVLTSEIASRQHMRQSYLHNLVDGISLVADKNECTEP
jgi:hypothetical protein